MGIFDASASYQIDALDAPLHLHDVHDALRSGGENHGVTQFKKSVFCVIFTVASETACRSHAEPLVLH